MDIQTFDLPDGQWAKIHRNPSHGQVKAITKKLIALSGTDDVLDIQTTMVLTLVESWLVRDGEGRDLPLNTEGVESAPQSIVTLITDECESAISSASPLLGQDLAKVPKPSKANPSPNP